MDSRLSLQDICGKRRGELHEDIGLKTYFVY